MSGTVIVACGGRSLEREISLQSGRAAIGPLGTAGFDAVLVDPDHTFVKRVREIAPKFVFVAMHGRGGEDGTLQDLLEILHVPYTGSDVHASARCLDKHAFKELMVSRDVPTPPWHSFNRDAFAEFGAVDTMGELTSQLGFPLVIKPSREGSSLGIKFVHSSDDFSQAIVGALNYDERVIIERYVKGRELAATVIGPSSDPKVLPIAEIRTKEPYYTFAAHYDIGAADLRVAPLDDLTRARVAGVATRAYAEAGCRDLARVDIILDGAGMPNVLEINTIPGLTETGPTRFSAEAAGMTMASLVERMIERARDEVAR